MSVQSGRLRFFHSRFLLYLLDLLVSLQYRRLNHSTLSLDRHPLWPLSAPSIIVVDLNPLLLLQLLLLVVTIPGDLQQKEHILTIQLHQ